MGGCSSSKPVETNTKAAPQKEQKVQKEAKPKVEEKTVNPKGKAPTNAPTLLVVKSSLNGDEGKSNQLVKEFVSQWKAKNANGKVVVRDLAADALPHLSGAEMEAWMIPAEKQTEEQKELAKRSDSLIAEFVAADQVVLGIPMYNFGVPSTFEAWVDRLCRPGVAFEQTATGPKSHFTSKPMYMLCARGGAYAGTPNELQTPYLKTTFGLLGQTDIKFVYAEGFAMGEGEKALADAAVAIAELLN